MATLYTSSIYLVFKPHETQVDVPIEFSRKEKKILRQLAAAYAEIAALPVHGERKALWRRLNDLQPVRPMVWIDEVCWHEMNVDDELTLRTESPFCRRIEVELRKTLYQWRHMPGDMIIDPVIYSPCILDNTGFGLPIEAEIRETAPDSDIASRHFTDQILSEEDVEKIKVPKVTHKPRRTEEYLQAYRELFDGVVQVEKRGVTSLWFAPWDEIVYWMGADHLLLNLADKPAHAAIRKELHAILTSQLDPDAVTRQAFREQERRLADLVKRQTAKEFYEDMAKRLGEGQAAVITDRYYNS